MEYMQYLDLDDANNNIANASHILNKLKVDDDDKDALKQAKRHLTEASFWILKIRGDI